jgi:hypothetical protein
MPVHPSEKFFHTSYSGKPGLKEAKDEMSEVNTLAAALVIAPIAGVASAISRYLYYLAAAVLLAMVFDGVAGYLLLMFRKQ